MADKTEREDEAVVLDFLSHGYVDDDRPSHKKTSIAHSIGANTFSLLELVPKKDVFLRPYDRVYIGSDKREKIHHVKSRLKFKELTQSAKKELDHVLEDLVKEKEERFIDFFNNAQPINTRMHVLELLPGVGKKHMGEIIEARDGDEFESFEDLRERVKLLGDPVKIIIRRLKKELKGEEKHKLFVGRK